MDETTSVQRRPNAADAAIHHVGGRHDIDPGCRVAERLLLQHGHRLVIEHVTAGVDQAVLAVRRVRIERPIGNHAQFGEFTLQRADHGRHQAIRIECLFGVQ